MGKMTLSNLKVTAAVVVNAWKSPVVDSAGEWDLQNLQPGWVDISYGHKQIAIVKDVHQNQLEAAATLTPSCYSAQALIHALKLSYSSVILPVHMCMY